MRLNAFLAHSTPLSRRSADDAIAAGRVQVNGTTATLGQKITTDDSVKLDGQLVAARLTATLIMLNKPAGYVCSRQGQGSQTIYDLLPEEYKHLQPVGRLDKQSSGLLLMTDDGQLLNGLAHPRSNKIKVYQVGLDRRLSESDKNTLQNPGVDIGDSRLSRLKIDGQGSQLIVALTEGRNRQIRRSFAALDYKVKTLHRTDFGDYHLKDLASGQVAEINTPTSS